MKKFILISPKNRTAYNFRGDLIKTIISKGYEVIVTGPNEIDVDRILALGARFELIPINKNGTNPIADLKYMLKLRKLMKREKPDATLGYTIKPAIYGAMAAKLAGVKSRTSMITGAGYLFIAKTMKAKLTGIIGKTLYKIGLACANHVIFQNEDDLAEFLQKHLVKAEKCNVVNGSGVNMEHFAVAPLPEKPVFFMLSRALYSKGVKEYLDACRIVHGKYPDVRCMYLGAIEPMPDAIPQEVVQSYVDDGSIEYFGETPDVRKFTEQCSVYVLPSYREGTPRTVLEAMAMGRPVITTDVPGCRGTVINGKTGFLVESHNALAVAEKMEWFIKNPDNVTIMGESSYKLCREKFEVGAVNDCMLSIMGI
jgi:glycosyltransferase involved in cell wall biosynthesis